MGIFRIASVFGSGMVLQMGEPVRVWGDDGDGTLVTVSLGSETVSCFPKNGHWECSFSAFMGGQTVSLCAKQGETSFEFSDIVFGDVWIAGGQSNMEFFLRYEKHWEETQKANVGGNIRMYTCPRLCFTGQEIYQDDVGRWFKAGERRWEYFSAVGYHFAFELTKRLDVPVGIISCNWGGTSASAWLPAERLKSRELNVYLKDYQRAAELFSEEECRQKSAEGWGLQKDPRHKARWAKVMFGLSLKEQEEYMIQAHNNPAVPMGPYNKNRPGCLYETMVKPLIGLGIKGVLWYQGENDVHHAELYSTLFRELISSWRENFRSDMPFLFVQLAPFGKWMNLDGERFPKIRSEQELVSESEANCFMTTTGDIGDETDIHPKEKREIGRRLALLAEEKVYHMDVKGLPPKKSDVIIEDNRIVICFENAAEGIKVSGSRINDLAILGDNRRIEAERFFTEKNRLIIYCRDLMQCRTISVRFAQSPYSVVNIYNSRGIPAVPFSYYRSV